MPAEVIYALNAYKRRQATMHNLMRSMLAHDGWFAPLNWVKRYLPQRTKPEKLLPLMEEGDWPPDGHLWVFTDEEEAYAAAETGTALGGYAGPLGGEELFGALGEGVTEVHVNAAAPPWRSFVVDSTKLEYVGAWANALRLERVLTAMPGESEGWLRKSIYLLPLDVASKQARVVRVENLPGVFVAAFTAPDRVHAFIAGLEAPLREQTAVTVLTCRQLFGMAAALPVAGVALNPDAPPCIVFPASRCGELAAPLEKKPEAEAQAAPR